MVKILYEEEAYMSEEQKFVVTAVRIPAFIKLKS